MFRIFSFAYLYFSILTVNASDGLVIYSDFPDEPDIVGTMLPKPAEPTPFKDIELNSFEIACIPYWHSQISNFFHYRDSSSVGEDKDKFQGITNGTKQWDPRLRILVTPQQAQEAFDMYYNKENWLFPTYAKALVLSQDEALPLYESERSEIFSDRFFGIPEKEEDRQQFFLTHDISFLTRPLIQAVYKGARGIMEKTIPGDTILIFGNTPYFVGRALGHLISSNPEDAQYRTLIFFPFSGAPNTARGPKQSLQIMMSKDIVDEPRLTHLRARMKASGLCSQNPKLSRLFLVDAIFSGAGPSYFLKELIRDYKQAQKQLPDINLISMNVINVENDKDHRHRHIANTSAADGETVALYFPSKEEPHFSVNNHVIHVEGHGFLDNLQDEKMMRALPAYNPHYWYPEFDYLLTMEQPRHMQKLFQYFDANIKSLISKGSKS